MHVNGMPFDVFGFFKSMRSYLLVCCLSVYLTWTPLFFCLCGLSMFRAG